MVEFAKIDRTNERNTRSAEAMRATVVGVVVNMALVIVKLIAGIVGASTALVADAVHSLADLLTDIFLLFTIRVAGKGADEQHPYGHGRADTIGAAVMGAGLMVVGVFIIYEVFEKISSGTLHIPTWLAICGALFSIVSKEGLFQYTYRVGKRIESQSVIANAWEHRSDALSGLAALVGISGAMMGFPILDPLAAIVVVYMVEKVGWELFYEALNDLMDTALPPEKLKDIKKVIMETDGVIRYHELRTRKLGADMFVDVHVLVQPNIAISEAHNIAETVRYNLQKNIGVADALVHIDAEDDINYRLVQVNREAVEEKIRTEARKIDGVMRVPEVIIHLLNGRMLVDFTVDIDENLTLAEARKRVEKLRVELERDSTIDMAVIRGRLTDCCGETGFYKLKKNGKDN